MTKTPRKTTGDADTGKKAAPALRARPCPICGKLALDASYPFCSPRCADIDLNRWMKGVYAIPVVEDPREPDEEDREF